MNTFRKARRWIVSLIGILPLIFSLANIKPVLADSAQADLSVQISANRKTVRLGQNITFTVKVTNLGPDAAFNVGVHHIYPDQLGLVDMICDHGISPDTPDCEYSVIEPGETVVSTVIVTPNPAALPHRRHLVVTASYSFLSAGIVDPHSRNNSDSVAVQWVGRFH